MAVLSDLKDRVFRMTSHKYNDTFHMVGLINDALNQLVSGARLRGSQSLSITIGTDEYALPTNFKSPGQLLDATDPNSVIPYQMVDISENRTGYAIEASKIIIKPVPQEVKTLTHYYYKYATSLSANTDTPDIDSQYHDLLAIYAAGMILLLPEMDQSDKTLADRYLGRWEDGKRNFIGDMQRKNKSTSGRVVTNW